MKQRKLLAILSVLGLLLCFSMSGFASNIDDLQSSQDELNQKKNDAKEKLEDVQEDKKATTEDLENLQGEIGVLQEDIAKLQGDLSIAEANLETQKKEYETILAALEESQKYMKERVRSIYINGDISYWEVLFSSSTIQDFLSSLVFCEKIVDQDKKIVTTIEENKRLAEEKLAELETTKAKIASLKSNKENQETALVAQSDAKDAMLSDLENDETYLEKELAAFEAESANIQSAIQSYYAEQESAKASAAQDNSNEEGSTDSGSGDSGNDYAGTGSMRWPVSGAGRISSDFGPRSRGYHTGIDIAISQGTPVVAADSGKVIIVKRLTYSYGQYVVIDHGGGKSTLYAHMSAIHVSQGQIVTKGQQVGAVGSTGNSTGPHLHFEVRINGKYVNPWSYVSR